MEYLTTATLVTDGIIHEMECEMMIMFSTTSLVNFV
jgi:hypothetical protein